MHHACGAAALFKRFDCTICAAYGHRCGRRIHVSGDVSRLTFAKVICQLTGRDTSPDTAGYSGNIQYFPDVTSSVDLVTEVSHEHDYMLDADGNEYWI